jgi:hypothetical protein
MSFFLTRRVPRRAVLRGLLQGAAVTVALPLLDCYLNNSGTALASGARLPVRFGTWFWGLGFSPGYGISDKSDQLELLEETEALRPYLSSMNFFSRFNAPLDGSGNLVHYSGIIVARTATAPSTSSDIPAPTIDTLVADAIGKDSRFRSISVASAGGARASYSARNSGERNAAEISPAALYTRLFGPDFTDPNKADFVPNPDVMLRKSVLSAVMENTQRLAKTVGAADRQRLDAYFTSIREMEQQLALQLQKPEPIKSCNVPSPVQREGSEADSVESGNSDIEVVLKANKVFAQLIAMAFACNQARVFNMTFSPGGSNLRRLGQGSTHHTLSHEEPKDAKLGYQPTVSWFNRRTMQGCADFVEAFASIPEGAGTLLDNTLIMAHSDTNDASVHALDAIPVMTFGRAGGGMKTGHHIKGNGDPISRVGLTVMQAVGVPIATWGAKTSRTSRPAQDVLA